MDPETAAASAAIHGAEADIVAMSWLGRDVVEKRRVPKGYRHAALDARLRDQRTRDEGHLLLAARAAGVPVPVVFDVDRRAATLCLERIAGRPLRDALPQDDEATAAARLARLGVLTGRLHDVGLTHGDLTTSNVLVPDGAGADALILIDFGLGQFSVEDEQHAVDLHLVEEALEATDPRAEALFAAFIRGYSADRDASGALRRLEAVRERGRYRGAAPA